MEKINTIGTRIQMPKNKAAIELLRSWREGDEDEQRETLACLKRALIEKGLEGYHMMSIQEFARILRGGFSYGIRADGEPQWHNVLEYPHASYVADFARECHAGMRPNDYRYRFIVRVLDTILESDNPDDVQESDMLGLIVNSSIYALAKWLCSGNGDVLGPSLRRMRYCDDAFKTFGFTSTFRLLQQGQLQEVREVFGLVLAFLRENIDTFADAQRAVEKQWEE
jgi:hypothetical protein